MSKIDDGGTAFPVVTETQQTESGSAQHFGSFGMSLRAYFAAKALPIANSNLEEMSFADAVAMSGLPQDQYMANNYQGARIILARRAVEIADVLIAELNKEASL